MAIVLWIILAISVILFIVSVALGAKVWRVPTLLTVIGLFLAGLVFFVLAACVLQSHKHWRDVARTLESQIKKEELRRSQLIGGVWGDQEDLTVTESGVPADDAPTDSVPADSVPPADVPPESTEPPPADAPVTDQPADATTKEPEAKTDEAAKEDAPKEPETKEDPKIEPPAEEKVPEEKAPDEKATPTKKRDRRKSDRRKGPGSQAGGAGRKTHRGLAPCVHTRSSRRRAERRRGAT